MKIELKKISIYERMSEETTAFVADLYINGKLVGECKNDGHGGCTDIRGNSKESNQLIAEAEAYFKSLPKTKTEGYNFEYQPSLEYFIDDFLTEFLRKKEVKKMKKIMQTAIVFGIPNANQYSYINYKRLLSSFETSQLQTVVNQIKAKYCNEGKVILNTNLQALGIVI